MTSNIPNPVAVNIQTTAATTAADAVAAAAAAAAAAAKINQQIADINAQIVQARTDIKNQYLHIAAKFQPGTSTTSPTGDSKPFPPGVHFYTAKTPWVPGTLTTMTSGASEHTTAPVIKGTWTVNYGWESPTYSGSIDPQQYDWDNSYGSSSAKKLKYPYEARPKKMSYAGYDAYVGDSFSVFIIHPYYSTLQVPNLRYCPDAASEYSLMDTLEKKLSELVIKRNNLINSIPGATGTTTTTTSGVLLAPGQGPVLYNVGSVSDAYFSAEKNWLNRFTTIGFANSPTAVTRAQQLWNIVSTSLSNKGMLQQWTQTGTSASQYVATPSTGNAGNADPSSLDTTSMNGQVRGFQFQYNPASVRMTYAGTPGVDPNYEASGGDKFNAVGVPAGTSSTISFSILINRVFDMKYYDPSTSKLLDKYNKDGTTVGNPYYPRQPESWEQQDIYNKGTMYDLEYLLRTLVGWTMTPYLTDRVSAQDHKTADIGFLTGRPIELHLGKSLRYLVFIGEVSVEHVLFDERMVPLFTNVGITCNRLPDFSKITAASTTDSGSNTYGTSTFSDQGTQWNENHG